MPNIDEKNQDIALYGKILIGDETEIEKTKLARIHYLKGKTRRGLSWEIGDQADNIADLARIFVMGEAIRLGIAKDVITINTYKEFIFEMLAGYGGESQALLSIKKYVTGLRSHIFDKYNVAKQTILAAEKAEEVDVIDIEKSNSAL